MKKILLGFGIGFCVGCIIGNLIEKNKSNNIISEIDDVLEENNKIIRDIEKRFKEMKNNFMEEEKDDTLQSNYEFGSKKKEKIKDYDECNTYKEEYEEIEEDPEIMNEDDGFLNDLEENERHIKDLNKEPEFITEEQFNNLPAGFTSDTLYYYNVDNVFVDDNEEELDNPEYFIGRLINDFEDGLDKIDMVNNTAYVLNYALDTAYEIIIVEEAFWNPRMENF